MESCQTSIAEGDDDAIFTVRRNGKVFYISVSGVSPSYFVNSPIVANTWKSHLKLLQSDEDVIDVYDWVMAPFAPLLTELAPDLPAESMQNLQLTLKECLLPECFVFKLDVINEKLQPRRVLTKSSPFVVSNLMTLKLGQLSTIRLKSSQVIRTLKMHSSSSQQGWF